MNKSSVFVGSIRRFDYCVQAYFPGLHTGDIPVDTHPAEVLIPRKQVVCASSHHVLLYRSRARLRDIFRRAFSGHALISTRVSFPDDREESSALVGGPNATFVNEQQLRQL